MNVRVDIPTASPTVPPIRIWLSQDRTLLIDGKWVPAQSGKACDVADPTTGSVIPEGVEVDVDVAAIDGLSDLFILGVPEHGRSDDGPALIATSMKALTTAVGAKSAYIAPLRIYPRRFGGSSAQMEACHPGTRWRRGKSRRMALNRSLLLLHPMPGSRDQADTIHAGAGSGPHAVDRAGLPAAPPNRSAGDEAGRCVDRATGEQRDLRAADRAGMAADPVEAAACRTSAAAKPAISARRTRSMARGCSDMLRSPSGSWRAAARGRSIDGAGCMLP